MPSPFRSNVADATAQPFPSAWLTKLRITSRHLMILAKVFSFFFLYLLFKFFMIIDFSSLPFLSFTFSSPSLIKKKKKRILT